MLSLADTTPVMSRFCHYKLLPALLAGALSVVSCKPRTPETKGPEAGEVPPARPATITGLPSLDGFSAASRQAREFEEEASDSGALKALTDRFWKHPGEREAILERLEAEFYTRDLLPFLQELVKSGNDEWVGHAIDLLAGNTSGEILQVLESCLGHREEEVRLAAVSAASQVRTGDLPGFLEKAFRDLSPAVRLSFFHEQEGQTDALLMRVYEKALAAPHQDVRDAGMSELELMSNPRALEVLFGALDSPYAETREEARATIDFLIEQEFDSASAARAWWQANRRRFSADLVRED